MTLFLVEDKELPLIRAQALIRTGERWEPAAKAGLAEVALKVMRTGGSKTRDGDALDKELDRMAASVETRAAELVFLAYRSDSLAVKALMAGGVAIGFLSHLVLDELYSVQWSGLRVRLNKAAGSAFKLVGRSYVPNVFTWTVLMFLTYLTLVDAGLIRDVDAPHSPPMLRQAAEVPERF